MKRLKSWGGLGLFAIVAALAGIGVLVGFVSESSVERHLRANGVTVMGTVTYMGWTGNPSPKDRMVYGQDKGRTYYMKVDVPVRGQVLHEDYTVTGPEYRRYGINGPVAVTYDPKKPSVNRLADDVDGGSSWGLLVFGIALLVVSGAVCLLANYYTTRPEEPSGAPSLDEALDKARRNR